MTIKYINLNIRKILALLPHRYPLLLVDRVLELDPCKTIKALKNVSINEPYFVGHFPTKPIMPGVLILEAMAQTAALLKLAETPCEPDSICYFVGVEDARFKRPVEPGDQLILDVAVQRSKCGIWTFLAHATVDGNLAAHATLMCTVMKEERD